MQDYTGALIDSCGRLKTSDVDPNTLHLDPVPDPEICSNLDPGPPQFTVYPDPSIFKQLPYLINFENKLKYF